MAGGELRLQIESTPRDAVYRYAPGTGFAHEAKPAPREAPVSLHINGRHWVTLLCTPTRLRDLALGFLYTSRVISSPEDVLYMRTCEEDGVIEVRLPATCELDEALARPRTLTSGCGGGVSFEALDGLDPVRSTAPVDPDAVLAAMHAMHQAAETYRSTGGVHTCALSDGARLLVVADDVGRHNAMDKIVGACLWDETEIADRWLVSSGRISSEMALKAARLGVPVVISHTAPTTLSLEVARRLGVTLIGYARGQRFYVYTGAERLNGAEGTA